MNADEKKAWSELVSDIRRCYSNYDDKFYCFEHSSEKEHDDAILAADLIIKAAGYAEILCLASILGEDGYSLVPTVSIERFLAAIAAKEGK